jgi:hypothetical protein
LSTELLNTANKDAAGLQASFTTAPKPQGSTVTAREVFERVTPVAPLRTVRRG